MKKKTKDMRGNNIYIKYGFNSLCFIPVVIQCNIGMRICCRKKYSCQSSLRTHHHIHTGDNPYQCQYCGKGFNQNGDLQ